jgi:DHA2 family multidrug resistance protein
LNQRNIIILGLAIFVFKFTQLADLMLVPAFLGNIQGYRPLQTGQALMWVALPAFAVAGLVATLMVYTNSRLILTVGLTVAAVACWFCAQLDTSWAANNFVKMELLMAVGFAGTFTGLVGSVVLEGLESGVLRSPANAATFSGFMHFIRIFGGAVGAALMSRFISVREQFHSNLLGLHVQTGNWLTDMRLRMLGRGLLPESTGPQQAQYRAITILGEQVRAQAYTMAIADGFILVGWMVAAYLLMTLLLKPGKVTFTDLRKMQ